MASDGAGRDAASDPRQHRRARVLVVAGFVIWAAGLGLWMTSWIVGLGATVAGGWALTSGLEYLGRRPGDPSRSLWRVSLPVAVSLVLISQGVGQSDYGARVVLVGVGTLGLVLVLLRIVEERIAIEHRLALRNLTDERRRLAGDVHDVVGHTLSASMLHTTAARLSVRSDPDAAIASLERAERHGRRSMDDIRSVVRLLRDDGDGRVAAPLSGDLPELVEEFRAAGADIVGCVPTEVGDLPAVTALTAYRVVQEGLTNAIRHGTGTIDLTVDRPGAGGHLEVRIGNDVGARAAATSGGFGLAGMRERVSAIGGSLDAGPADSHRWVLCARIPT